LADKPLELQTLLYNGFAYFYRGVNQFSFEEKIALFDRCIFNLRKAILLNAGEMQGRALYVLGKAYYYKGKYYADLTIEYLLKAEQNGYVGDDTYEYLGLAYTSLGEYEKSADSFLKAVAQEPTDTRYLALAQAYFNQGLVNRSEEYLLRTLNTTADPAIEEKTRFLLAKIYFETDQLSKSEDQYRRILEKNPESADAYFFLGEIYSKYDKETEARYYWRQAHMIDPSHYGARLRLF
jgi:tetratricopeptide (TPR) repeat protein